MARNLLKYLSIILFLEIVLHIACFSSINIIQAIMILLYSIMFSILNTFIISIIKPQKLKKAFFVISTILLFIIFTAQLVYFKIYESFFTISGIVFIGALKDGYDKILVTIFQNIFYIILFITPIIIFIVKASKNLGDANKQESIILIFILFLSIAYSSYLIDNDKKDNDSLYNLMYQVNIPKSNVENFGLLETSMISFRRSIFDFEEVQDVKEDILTNKKSVLNVDSEEQYNELNIDFEQLAQNEKKPKIKELHKYFANQPSTVKNEFTGMFEGKNLIFIMAESLDEIAIDKKLTPTLYKLKHEGIVFNNYFSPKYPASTADGEYMLEWGLLPVIGNEYSLIDLVYNKRAYLLPLEFKKMKYKTYVYHDYYGYYNLRKKYFSTLKFDKMRYCEDGFNMRCSHFHGSDVDMMNQSIDDYINKDHFYAYYITLSGHGSYDSSNFVAQKHINKLNGYNYSSSLKYYMAAHIDFDIAMNKLITKLEKANKLDDTVIVISSDHSPYYLSDDQMTKRSKMNRGNKFDRNRGSLIIYNSELKKPISVDKYAMNIDVLPTVLNMFGIEYDSRLLIGKDIMADNNEGLVILPDRSFITNYGAYDSNTKKFKPYLKVKDKKYIQQKVNEVNNKYKTSVNMQYSNYYKYVIK